MNNLKVSNCQNQDVHRLKDEQDENRCFIAPTQQCIDIVYTIIYTRSDGVIKIQETKKW